jgi:magnesium transporter
MSAPASRSDAAEPVTGEQPVPGPPRGGIRLAIRGPAGIEESEDGAALTALEAASRAGPGKDPTTILWIDLTDPDPELVQRIAQILGLHPLIAEDVSEGNQRAKVEATDGLVHVVLFSLELAAGVRAHEIDLVLGDGFLLSAHPSQWDPRAGAHFRGGLEAILKTGPDHLLWAIVDSLVDAYFPFADGLEDRIDRLQDDVVDRPSRSTLEALFALKRDLIAVRRAVSPVREILNQLTNREQALIDPEEIIYFRDIYDHVIRLADELDTDRELVAASVEIYLSTINNTLSTIMKRLTGVTVILAGVGAIAGIFGMSEAGLAFSGAEAAGFWMVSVFVVALAAAAALVLRKIDWI